LSGDLEDDLTVDLEADEDDYAVPVQALAGDLSALRDAHRLEGLGL
jgi:hypothetical protein